MKRKIKELKVGDSEVIRVKNREGYKVPFRVVRIKLGNDKLKYRVQWSEPIKGIKKKDRGDKRFNERFSERFRKDVAKYSAKDLSKYSASEIFNEQKRFRDFQRKVYRLV